MNKSKIVSIVIAVTVVFSILLALSATTSACHCSLTANAGGPYTGIAGEPITFDGSASSVYCSYTWDFGDGNIATGRTPTHAYTATGDYTVTLM